MADSTNYSSQQFKVLATQLVSPGSNSYFLKPAHATNMALDRPGGNTTNGTVLQLWQRFDRNDNQCWQLLFDESINCYYIHPKSNLNKVIEILSFNTTDGGSAGIWDKWDGNNVNQRWMIIPVVRKTGRYVVFNVNSVKALDATAQGKTNGTRIQQWEYVNAESEEWELEVFH
jgi:hypothetical protein